jgi:hypothetical protein
MCERLSILAIAGLAACHGVDVEPPDSGTDRGLPAVAERSEPGANLHASRTPGTAQRFPLALAGVPLPIPVSTQFDITGFLQEAHTAGPNAGGASRVSGQVVAIPANTIVILPANALTWDELFTEAPAPYSLS